MTTESDFWWPTNIINGVNDPLNWIILGDSGAGKTTLAEDLALKTSDSFMNRPVPYEDWLSDLCINFGPLIPQTPDLSSLAAKWSTLDSLERSLEKKNKTILNIYDGVNKDLKDLLMVWMSMSHRYKRLRAKILLTPEEFSKYKSAFCDASKMVDHAFSIYWSTSNLYYLGKRLLKFPSLDSSKKLTSQQKDFERLFKKKGNKLKTPKELLEWIHLSNSLIY